MKIQEKWRESFHKIFLVEFKMYFSNFSFDDFFRFSDFLLPVKIFSSPNGRARKVYLPRGLTQGFHPGSLVDGSPFHFSLAVVKIVIKVKVLKEKECCE